MNLNFHAGSLKLCTFSGATKICSKFNFLNTKGGEQVFNIFLKEEHFILKLLINAFLFVSDGASDPGPQVPSSRIRKSKFITVIFISPN